LLRLSWNILSATADIALSDLICRREVWVTEEATN
jgi:hypothetical protein